jgi:hypothetical protein
VAPTPPSPSVDSLPQTAVWTSLTPLQQSQLDAVRSAEGSFGSRARWGLANVLSSPAYQAAAPAEQVKLLQAALRSTPVLPGLVTIDAASQMKQVTAPVLKGPTLEKNHVFPGKTTDADRYVVTLDGQDIPVFTPHDGTYQPPNQTSIEDTTRALAMLPVASRALVKEVSLDPVRNPQDEFWARTYNQPNFSSYMTCGAQGHVDVYPTSGPSDFKYMADTMVHETGHAWSNAKWGDDGQADAWKGWREAIAKDGIPPSEYAMNAPEEDVAESTALYLAMKGTPLFDNYRKLYPNRFALLDEQFK